MEISILHLSFFLFKWLSSFISKLFVWPFSKLVSFTSKPSFRLEWSAFLMLLLQNHIEFIFIDALEFEVSRRYLRLSGFDRFLFLDIWVCPSAATYWVSALSLIRGSILFHLLFIVFTITWSIFWSAVLTGRLFCLPFLSYYLLDWLFFFWLRWWAFPLLLFRLWWLRLWWRFLLLRWLLRFLRLLTPIEVCFELLECVLVTLEKAGKHGL